MFIDHLNAEGQLRKARLRARGGGGGRAAPPALPPPPGPRTLRRSSRPCAAQARCARNPPTPRPPPPAPAPPPPLAPQLILDVVQVRKAHAIHSRSKVTVRKAAADIYAATIDDKALGGGAGAAGGGGGGGRGGGQAGGGGGGGGPARRGAAGLLQARCPRAAAVRGVCTRAHA